MFGLGWAELIILAIIGLALIGVPLVVIVVVLRFLFRPNRLPAVNRSGELEQLRTEVIRLRAEIERLKKERAETSTDFTTPPR